MTDDVTIQNPQGDLSGQQPTATEGEQNIQKPTQGDLSGQQPTATEGGQNIQKPTHGVITVIIKDPQGNEVGQFVAEDGKNIAELAAMHGVMIPVSCGGGVCGVCLCKVEQGKEAVKADAFNTPLMPLKTDEAGNPEEVLTCIAGFNPEAFNDGKDHTVVLQRTY